jgi:hypothetical protein
MKQIVAWMRLEDGAIDLLDMRRLG